MKLLDKGRFKSLRFQIGLGICLIVIPLLVLLIYGDSYATKVVRNQVALANTNLVTLNMREIDQNLTEVDKYLYSMAAVETDLQVLDVSNTDQSQNYYMAKIRLDNRLSSNILNYRNIDSFFVYSIRNDDLLSAKTNTYYEDFSRVQTQLQSMLQDPKRVEEDCLKKWCDKEIDGNYYLLHVVKVGNVYIGAWCNVQRLMTSMNMIRFGKTGVAILATEQFLPMTNKDFALENKIDLREFEDNHQLSGKDGQFLVVGTQSGMGGFHLLAVTPGKEILENLPLLHQMIQAILYGSVIVAILFLFMLRQIILKPLNHILAAMRRIREGNWDTEVASTSRTNEFELMNITFNSMISEIQKLKIDIYEEQINKQRAELRHLQLQINPHFFLNSLNIVYHLARARDYELIEELSLSLVEYFRFMFRSNLKFVRLEEELQHVCNYLKIQEMRFPDYLTFEILASEQLRDVLVPPLLIQTFVENTIKHVVSTQHTTRIGIFIESFIDDEILIRITDTGPGFSTDVLQRLITGQMEVNEQGEHIGIWNARRRLALLYEDRADINFSNGDGEYGGATIDISLPVLDKVAKGEIVCTS
ncbi:sensor histidine kinase [Paenibacillus aestuarii]|uniref:Sensor histidine kinase n=1 Tax=Paenibacillus aestuarii TaxID=516965 RepID=A0ABW0KA03_9BACL|nr:histidine kinase [Paenibacillus aestuarii]